MPSDERDPIAALPAALQPGERVTVRHRLADGSATDVIGWVHRLGTDRIELSLDPERRTAIERADIIAVRQVPPARGGPDPMRLGAEQLQRIIVPAWLDRHQSCGDWTLRAADGFTRRANSCLAVGDPGLPWDDAAERVIDFYRGQGLDPLVQVIADDPAEHALLARGWQTGGPDTDLLVTRLSGLIGHRSLDADGPAVELAEALPERWLDELVRQRGLTEPSPASRAVLAGPAPVVFASVITPVLASGSDPDPDATSGALSGLIAMARGQLSDGWLGVTAVWTRPDHRRRGLAHHVIDSIARWAAIRGARNVYLQVARDNAVAQAAYAGLGFTRHHGYRYLRAPD